MGLHFFHLGHLFRQMHVQRRMRAQGGGAGEVFGRDGAQAVRGNADAGIGGQGAKGSFGTFHQPGEAVHVIAEADLSRPQRPPVAAAILIEHRQQRQADAGCGSRRCDAGGHFGKVSIGLTARLVMDVVELHIGGIACLQHLHLHEGGNRFHILRRQLVEKAEHQLAPGPETVPRIRSPPLGQSRHGALEGVGMQVGRGRQQQAKAHSILFGLRSGGHMAHLAIRGDMHRHAACPAIGQKRLFCPQNLRRERRVSATCRSFSVFCAAHSFAAFAD